MSDSGSTLSVWREAAAIVGRYPAAAIAPGAVAEVPHYFARENAYLGYGLTYVTAVLAYYLYLAYAGEVLLEYERGKERITLRTMIRELREAAS